MADKFQDSYDDIESLLDDCVEHSSRFDHWEKHGEDYWLEGDNAGFGSGLTRRLLKLGYIPASCSGGADDDQSTPYHHLDQGFFPSQRFISANQQILHCGMNTNKARSEVWSRANGELFHRIADHIEARDGPILSRRDGELLRGVGDAVENQSGPLIEDKDIEKVL